MNIHAKIFSFICLGTLLTTVSSQAVKAEKEILPNFVNFIYTKKRLDFSSKQSFKQIEKLLSDQDNKALNRLSEKFGYDPRDYRIEFKIAGENITIFDSSYWIKMRIRPTEGIIEVKHQTIIQDKLWHTPQRYDHLPISTKFTLDPNYCKAILRQDDCTFTGTDFVQLPNFISNHLMIKNGMWQITYVESGKEITYSFRIGYQSMPKGFNREISLREVNEDMCQLFPDGLICPRQIKKIQKK
jgi:hypothetical protein